MDLMTPVGISDYLSESLETQSEYLYPQTDTSLNLLTPSLNLLTTNLKLLTPQSESLTTSLKLLALV